MVRRDELDLLVILYSHILLHNLMPNLTVEILFTIELLVLETSVSQEESNRWAFFIIFHVRELKTAAVNILFRLFCKMQYRIWILNLSDSATSLVRHLLSWVCFLCFLLEVLLNLFLTLSNTSWYRVFKIARASLRAASFVPTCTSIDLFNS